MQNNSPGSHREKVDKFQRKGDAMTRKQFALYTMTCENITIPWFSYDMREICEITGQLCDNSDNCPVLNKEETDEATARI